MLLYKHRKTAWREQMKLEWMGKYRKLVEAMIGMGNAYSQVSKIEVFGDDVKLNSVQLQVMEYTLENEELNQNMSQIAQRLSISQSNFSKITNQLVKKGMLEKFHTRNNSKNVIIKVTEKGREFYKNYSQNESTDVWRRIFKKLKDVDDKDVAVFVECLNEFTNQINHCPSAEDTKGEELIKIK